MDTFTWTSKGQDDQLETTYSNSVPIRDADLRTCRKQWTIEKGGERGSGISLPMARHDDNDIYIYIYREREREMCVCVCVFDVSVFKVINFVKMWIQIHNIQFTLPHLQIHQVFSQFESKTISIILGNDQIWSKVFGQTNLVSWFLCLMAYRPLLVI